MLGISRYEKTAALLTAGFLLFVGGYFAAGRLDAQPWRVTAGQAEGADVSTPAQSQAQTRPESLLEGEVIDLNTASVYDLQRLPGIGEKRAAAIVEYREEHGPFETVDALTQVWGIGDGILSGLREYVTVG